MEGRGSTWRIAKALLALALVFAFESDRGEAPWGLLTEDQMFHRAFASWHGLGCDPKWSAADADILFLAEPTTSFVARSKDIDIDVVLVNESEERLLLLVTDEMRDYLVRVVDESDAELAPRESAVRAVMELSMYMDHARRHRIPPGGEDVAKIHLSDWYDLSRPGRYTIFVSRCVDMADRDDGSQITTNGLVITVPGPDFSGP